MTWLQRYQLRAFLGSSLWIIPLLAMVLALLLAPALRLLDAATNWTLFGFGSEGARALAAGLTASVFTFVVLVFSFLLVAVQVASANLSPRVIAGLLAHRTVRISLGLMVFTFVDGLAVLARIGDEVPQLPLTVFIAASLLSIVAFVYLVDHMSRRLRPVSVLAQAGIAGARVIAVIYPRLLGQSGEPETGHPGFPRPGREVRSPGGGVVLAFDFAGLADLARAGATTIELVPQVGDFVARGDVIFRVHGGGRPLADEELLTRIALGVERTVEQDPAFAFRIIADIAAKALSPAINDPTTAVLAIDQLHHLLRDAGNRELDVGLVRDRGGPPLLLYRTPGWEDFVELAVTEIRHYGAGSIQVARRLRAMLEDLIAALPDERRAALHEELSLLGRSAERAFVDLEDRERASRGDSQGLGGKPRGGSDAAPPPGSAGGAP